jgi:hypothetical protein
MTRDDVYDPEVTTEAEFDAALNLILDSAVSNGLDPRGSWVYRNGDSHPDWEVLVAELQKDAGAE